MSGLVSKLADWLIRVNAFRRNQYVVPSLLVDDGTNLYTDASKSNVWKITLNGNKNLLNPTNLKEGMILTYNLDQDGTGTRTVTYGSLFKAVAGQTLVLSTVASSKDTLSCIYDGTILRCSLGKGYA